VTGLLARPRICAGRRLPFDRKPDGNFSETQPARHAMGVAWRAGVPPQELKRLPSGGGTEAVIKVGKLHRIRTIFIGAQPLQDSFTDQFEVLGRKDGTGTGWF
jgi:hypothetical protein